MHCIFFPSGSPEHTFLRAQPSSKLWFWDFDLAFNVYIEVFQNVHGPKLYFLLNSRHDTHKKRKFFGRSECRRMVYVGREFVGRRPTYSWHPAKIFVGDKEAVKLSDREVFRCLIPSGITSWQSSMRGGFTMSTSYVLLTHAYVYILVLLINPSSEICFLIPLSSSSSFLLPKVK